MSTEAQRLRKYLVDRAHEEIWRYLAARHAVSGLLPQQVLPAYDDTEWGDVAEALAEECRELALDEVDAGIWEDLFRDIYTQEREVWLRRMEPYVRVAWWDIDPDRKVFGDTVSERQRISDSALRVSA